LFICDSKVSAGCERIAAAIPAVMPLPSEMDSLDAGERLARVSLEIFRNATS